MCGIAGFISSSVKDGMSLLRQMNDSLQHRGPDDEGFFLEGPVGLAMRRLSIIDISSGHQPMFSEDKKIALVFNGEIYNYKEIRTNLQSRGHQFKTNSDTEVIIHLYRELGVGCLEPLVGMFAFALLDIKENQIFLARDRFGEKPLHYYEKNGELFFASEIKAILKNSAIQRKLNVEALNQYLTFECVPSPNTIYNDIKKVPPGHFLLFKNSKSTLTSYWQPSFTVKSKMELKEAIPQLEDKLARAVALRTVSDVPIGAFLSGGVDSSIIASYLVESASARVKTFSVSFNEKTFDESAYAKRVADYLGTEHYEARFSSKDMLDIFPKVIEDMDEPFADNSLLPMYLLSKHTRQHVKVAISGDAGDELFSGYPTYQAHKVAQFIPGLLAKPLRILSNSIRSSDENITFGFKVRKFLSGLSFANPVRNQVWLGAFDPMEKIKIFKPSFFKKFQATDEFKGLKDYWSLSDGKPLLDRLAALDFQFYLQDDILVKVDRSSMANSLEVRVPFLDHELVHFVGSLGPSLRMHGLKTKYILKKIAEKRLPKDIVYRPKKGFGAPVAKWFKNELHGSLLDVLGYEKVAKEGIFDPDVTKRLIEEHLSGKFNHYQKLWTLFVFQTWRNHHGVSW